MPQPTAPEPPHYIPECDVDELPDGRLRVIHRESGRTTEVDTWRQAHIRATGISIAHTWRGIA